MKHTYKIALLSLCAFAQEMNAAGAFAQLRAQAGKQVTALRTLIGARVFSKTAPRLAQPTTATARSVMPLATSSRTFPLQAFRTFSSDSGNKRQNISQNWSFWGITTALGWLGYETRTDREKALEEATRYLIKQDFMDRRFHDVDYNDTLAELRRIACAYPPCDTIKPIRENDFALFFMDLELSDKNFSLTRARLAQTYIRENKRDIYACNPESSESDIKYVTDTSYAIEHMQRTLTRELIKLSAMKNPPIIFVEKLILSFVEDLGIYKKTLARDVLSNLSKNRINAPELTREMKKILEQP